MTSTDTLLPCPMCGGEPFLGNEPTISVVCTSCLVSQFRQPSEPEAIAAWNRRTTPTPATDTREAVARAYQAGAEAVHKAWVDCGGNCPGDPDFWEAAHDYADAHPSVAAEILAAEAMGYAKAIDDAAKLANPNFPLTANHSAPQEQQP